MMFRELKSFRLPLTQYVQETAFLNQAFTVFCGYGLNNLKIPPVKIKKKEISSLFPTEG